MRFLKKVSLKELYTAFFQREEHGHHAHPKLLSYWVKVAIAREDDGVVNWFYRGGDISEPM